MAELYRTVVMGASAGGMSALATILARLPKDFPASVVIVQHVKEEGTDGYRAVFLGKRCPLPVKEAIDKEPLKRGIVYLAPAGYHLLVEETGTLSLSVDPPVNFSRPSIDVLFESAATVFGERLIGVILTGANSDGSHGIRKIKEYGGYTMVQAPSEAEVPAMPLAAMESADIDAVLTLAEIGGFLTGIGDHPIPEAPAMPHQTTTI
ncbi:MAG: chemotaxis protein CheB [Desulfobulbaceae bacterium]|nr:chemotaxis protein CheB [Desulfobulbaceae bacterium]